MNTKDFMSMTDEQYKKQTILSGQSDPCDAHYVSEEKGFLTKECFDKIEKTRYKVQPWILEDLKKWI